MKKTLRKAIAAIRGFNRNYTNMLGLIDQHVLESGFSLAEVRVLHEIGKTRDCTSKKLSNTLSMDPGYLSRMLKQFEKIGLVEKSQSPEDGRAYFISLTLDGEEKLAELNRRSDKQIEELLEPLSEEERFKLVRNVQSVERLLTGDKHVDTEELTVRNMIKFGDIGYLTYMHGWIYGREYHYSIVLEAYVAKTFYDFMTRYDPDGDRLWIVEHHKEIVVSIAIMGHGDKAQLRWFLLHPDYRGLGLGRRLLNDALEYCRSKGYRSVFLETTDDLHQAVSLYTKAGFVRVAAKENHVWADNVTELRLELKLTDASAPDTVTCNAPPCADR